MIKAIETVYKGYRFRSRLEARWAVFFDTLGIEWEYEKEGYDLDGVWYLPDFWLPTLECWVEVKGQEPSYEEIKRASLLAERAEKAVYIFFGEIPLPDENYKSESSHIYIPEGMDYPHWWCECPYCGMLGIHYLGYAERLPCKHVRGRESFHYSPRLTAAYTAARQARFEHGESPSSFEDAKTEKVVSKKPVRRSKRRDPMNAEELRKCRNEQQDKLSKFAKGDRVHHALYGEGVIERESWQGSPVWIRFESGNHSGWFAAGADDARYKWGKIDDA